MGMWFAVLAIDSCGFGSLAVDESIVDLCLIKMVFKIVIRD